MLGRLAARLHLILGLGLAVYVTVMSLTGILILFREDLLALQHPAIRSAQAGSNGQATISPQEALELYSRQNAGWNPLSITWPHEGSPHWMIFAMQGNEARELYISTVDGKLIAEIDPHAGWLGFAERIHNNWSFGRNGRLFNGYAGWGMIALSLTGLWLVLPRLHTLFHQPVWRARPLHYALGIVSLWFALGIAFSGTYYTWGTSYRNLAFTYLGQWPTVAYEATSVAHTLDFNALIEKASEVMPGKFIQRTGMPNPKFPFRVTFRESSMREFHRVSTVVLNPVTGSVLALENDTDRPAGNRLVAWLSAFHAGVLGGRTGQFLWAAMSAALVVLSVSGVWIWWRKR